MRTLFAFLALILFSQVFGESDAFADGFTLKPAVMYYSNKDKSGATTTGSTYQWIDVGLGYTSGMFFFGALYHTPTFTSHGATECAYNHSGWGPSFGLRGDAAYLVGTYFLENKRTGCGTGLKSGTHYQVDAGYAFSVGSFKVAPQLSYYSWEYTESDAGQLSQPISYFGLTPMVALIIDF